MRFPLNLLCGRYAGKQFLATSLSFVKIKINSWADLKASNLNKVRFKKEAQATSPELTSKTTRSKLIFLSLFRTRITFIRRNFWQEIILGKKLNTW